MISSGDADSPIVPGRNCNECSMCCKVLQIVEIKKPAGKWCPHCAVGRGCRSYAVRPQECREFYCGYLTLETLDDNWKPSHAKLILVGENGGRRISVYVDWQRPDAWRGEPYYSQLKEWARNAAVNGGQVIVTVGERVYMILPDRDEDLGLCGQDEMFVIEQVQTPLGIKVNATKRPKAAAAPLTPAMVPDGAGSSG